MTYVYILRSLKFPDKTYIGVTADLKRRLEQHNTGRSVYSRKFMPWRLEVYVAFSKVKKARSFERFLKMGGGWRFAQKRLI